MTTRRRYLAGVGGLAVIAGCGATRETSSPRTVCEAGLGGDGGDVVFALTPQVSTYGAGEEPLVELVVPIRRATMESRNVDRLVVLSGEEVLHRIPVNPNDEPVGESDRYDTDDVVEYSQSLGHVPQAGIHRIVALTPEGEEIDRIRIEFRCYRFTDGE